MTNAEARFNKIHIRKVYACLAVTCHLHFWQNDRDFLRATVVTRGWNGYRNKSQHRKSTLEKKILLPFQQGFEPATFQSRVRCSNHWAIPAPILHCYFIVYYYTGSSSVNWLAVSCILTVTLWDMGFKCKSSTRFMVLIINHFVMYYSNPQVNYMVTVFIRLVIAVV